MKKFLRYSCSICNRSIDKIASSTHFETDKCNITFKCEGRLFPIEYRSNGSITATRKTGATDWRPRGATVIKAAEKQTTFINTSCGITGQVVLAVKTNSIVTENSIIKIKFRQESDAPKNYRQYVYRTESSFSTISGVESGLEKKTLRYTSTDSIQVYLNGVELKQGTAPEDYQVYNQTNTSAAPPNTIRLNQTISFSGISQVDVIVSPIIVITQIEIPFNRNKNDESRISSGSWENVDSISIFNGARWDQYYLFSLDLSDLIGINGLNINTILSICTSVMLDEVFNIQISDVQILLAREPYSILDRYSNLTIPLSNFGFDSEYLKYFVLDKKIVLHVTETAVSTLYPLMKISKFSPEKTIQTALVGVTNQIILDGTVIVGPDT